MTSPASIAFDRIVLLLLCGALTPALLTSGQAASERAERLREERARLKERLTGTGIYLPTDIALHELRRLAAVAGIGDLDPSLPVWAAQSAPAINSEHPA